MTFDRLLSFSLSRGKPRHVIILVAMTMLVQCNGSESADLDESDTMTSSQTEESDEKLAAMLSVLDSLYDIRLMMGAMREELVVIQEEQRATRRELEELESRETSSSSSSLDYSSTIDNGNTRLMSYVFRSVPWSLKLYASHINSRGQRNCFAHHFRHLGRYNSVIDKKKNNVDIIINTHDWARGLSRGGYSLNYYWKMVCINHHAGSLITP